MDEREFGRLYETYADKIYSFIYYRTSHRETAEDLTSRTFIKAIEKINSFDQNKGQFSTWLYTIARNTVIDFYRTEKSTGDIFEMLDLAGTDNIERSVGSKLEIEKVEKYLRTLEPSQREIIVMRVWDDLSYREIAAVLGKTEGACKVMFSRTIAKLNSSLALLILLELISANLKK